MWFRLGSEPEENCGGPTLPACHFEANEGAYLPNLDETFFISKWLNDKNVMGRALLLSLSVLLYSTIAFACLIYTLWPADDVTEGSTQEAPMGASFKIGYLV